MRKLFLVAGILLAAACADRTTNPEQQRDLGPARDLAPGCQVLSYADLQTLVNQVYGAGTPDANAALGKLQNLQHQLTLGDVAEAQVRAWDLVEFTVGKYKAGTLIAPESLVMDLVNGLLCYAGLAPFYSTIDNSWIVRPGDPAQILVSDDGWAGLSLPANPVTEPTVIAITRLADTPSPLTTDLDTYPLNYLFDKSSATDAPFTQLVTVAVCPASGIDPAIESRLQLGHQDEVDGFEVLPPAPATFLDCSSAPPLPVALQAAMDVASAAQPDTSSAQLLAFDGRGGVGGLADSFSPLAPVDPELTGRGGVGGTADSFRPLGAQQSLACTAIEAPIGSPVSAACRPTMTFTTFLGTQLDGIPVTFSVESGGGAIAALANLSCPVFSGSVVVPTSTLGEARVCWNLGLTAGTNTVVATAGHGGDAVPETYFVYSGADGVAQPAASTVRFTATANPPSALDFSVQPAAGSSIVAGMPIPITVRVLDRNGDVVLAYNGPVSVAINQHTFAAGSVTTATAVNGIATFGAIAITKAATGYVITAQATLNGQAVLQPGNTFDVVASAPVVITKLAGDAQVVAAGTAVPVSPSVRLTDTHANPVPGVVVLFEAQNNVAGVTGGTQTTDNNGVATVGSWTILDGPNSLIAYLQSNPLVFTIFTGTGSSSLALLNACPAGGGGDALAYPFFIPGSNKDVTQVELYLSSNGSANTPRTYLLALDARLNSFGNPVVATAQVPVTLTGKTSQALPTAFRFNLPIDSKSSDKIAFSFRVLGNPDGAGVFYNTGPCGLGGCKPPRGCSVTQVSGTTPLPLGTIRRQSVAIRVLGQ